MCFGPGCGSNYGQGQFGQSPYLNSNVNQFAGLQQPFGFNSFPQQQSQFNPGFQGYAPQNMPNFASPFNF